MRNEREMMELILGTAKRDERVRAVALNGSRANPKARKDIFQDYDIVYLVTETGTYANDPSWIDVFGERIVMQTPEPMPGREGALVYLMLFADGNRIDLTLLPTTDRMRYLGEDRQTVVLLDKDRALPALPPPTDEDYWVRRPTAAEYRHCCNEFWWVSTYVAKGLWRQEFLYAADHLNDCVRPMLIRMLTWKFGAETGFALSVGKNGKNLERLLPASDWRELQSTYALGDYEGTWEALLAMGPLFRRTATDVAERLGFVYDAEEDRRTTAYLECVRRLPPDASAFDTP